jgi:hypothetical protein
MIHISNSLTADFECQLVMTERRVGDVERPLAVEKIRGELSLRFDRLNSKSMNNSEGEICTILSDQIKGIKTGLQKRLRISLLMIMMKLWS